MLMTRGGPIGKVGLEPLAKQLLQLQRQAQQHVAGRFGAGLARRLQNLLDLAVVEGRE